MEEDKMLQTEETESYEEAANNAVEDAYLTPEAYAREDADDADSDADDATADADNSAADKETEQETEEQSSPESLAARTIFVDRGTLRVNRSEDDEAGDDDEYDAEGDSGEERAGGEETSADQAEDASADSDDGVESSAESSDGSNAADEGNSDDAAADSDAEPEPLHELSEEDRLIVEKIRLRKIATERKKKWAKRRMIIGVTIAVLAVISFGLSFTPIFTVDSIEVKGNKHFTGDEIINMGHASPGKNIIYQAGKKDIEEYLERNPYIKSADVSRKLPSTLVIKVKERTPMMSLKYDDDYLILDIDGILLQKSPSKPKLTQVQGNIITKIKLGQPLGTKNQEIMDKSVKLMQSMDKNDLYFVKLDMSDLNEVRAYVYDSLIVRNDYDTLMENIENGKLHKVLDKLFDESIKRGTVVFNEDGTSSFIPTF